MVILSSQLKHPRFSEAFIKCLTCIEILFVFVTRRGVHFPGILIKMCTCMWAELAL